MEEKGFIQEVAQRLQFLRDKVSELRQLGGEIEQQLRTYEGLIGHYEAIYQAEQEVNWENGPQQQVMAGEESSAEQVAVGAPPPQVGAELPHVKCSKCGAMMVSGAELAPEEVDELVPTFFSERWGSEICICKECGNFALPTSKVKQLRPFSVQKPSYGQEPWQKE